MILRDHIFVCCLSICLAAMSVYIVSKSEVRLDERNKTMNQNKNASSWLAHINSVTEIQKSGVYTVQDKQGTPITVEWHKTTMMTPEFVTLMASVSNVGIAAFVDVEMQFLRAFSEVVGVEPYFKPFEPFFKDGIHNVDWQGVEKTMRAIIKSHFIFDVSTFADEIIKAYATSIFFCVTVKNSHTNELLGYITYMVQPDFAYGMVKVTGMGVDPVAQRRGLGKLLMSSIFNIVPDVQRIFLCTRVTNTSALAAYGAWGFVKSENLMQDAHHMFNPKYWIFMQYDAQKNGSLC